MVSTSVLLQAMGAVASEGGTSVVPFTYHAAQRVLDDLRFRLQRTCFPDRETVAGWSEGVPLHKLCALVDYWRTGYDWRRCESTLNLIPAIPHDHRFLGYPLLACAIPSCGRSSADHYAWLARFGNRVLRDSWTLDEADRA